MKRLPALFAGLLLTLTTAAAPGRDPTRVFPDDRRLEPPVTLNDYFPFVPTIYGGNWEARKKAVREQVLVATGLWPLPERPPLKAVIHGKIDRDGYTVEKVFFASHPGHYVSGNLYRPKGRKGPLPAVLGPHGHWRNGRFQENTDAEAKEQLKQGAEKTPEGARYPVQAKFHHLARMGCVVFHYDMVGYADSSQPIAHSSGFTDAEAELRGQSFMGLQTWNSIRALDFLLSLPEVDPKRIGVTGASGGGTQTFILCAIDDRPAAAFPAVMVSTAMQGGCVCENCSYLRLGTGNIELAALFAPRPLALSGANDWTIDIETKGLPQLKTIYRLHGAEDKVAARCWPEFGHNYNLHAREFMYAWFNTHLKLGLPEPVREQPFVPVPPKELAVYDAEHPRPRDAADAKGLRKYLTAVSEKQLAALQPRDARGLAEFRRVIGTALRVMTHDEFPRANEIEARPVGQPVERDKVRWQRLALGRYGKGEQVPAVLLRPADHDGTVVVWVHPAGKASLVKDGKLTAAARQILEKKAAILAPDVFLTGEYSSEPPAVHQGYAGYTFGYNRPLLANRVHDILTAVGYAKHQERAKTVHLLGLEKAGPWVALARGLCGDAVARTAADLDQFRFEKVTTTADEMMLPGALKYGGLPALAALAAPGELYLHNGPGAGTGDWTKAAYQAANAAEKLRQQPEKATAEEAAGWLLR